MRMDAMGARLVINAQLCAAHDARNVTESKDATPPVPPMRDKRVCSTAAALSYMCSTSAMSELHKARKRTYQCDELGAQTRCRGLS